MFLVIYEMEPLRIERISRAATAHVDTVMRVDGRRMIREVAVIENDSQDASH